MAGCRDCPRCYESCIVSLLAMPFRLAWYLASFWNVGLFHRNCPHCGHRLRIHERVGGRFLD